VTDPVLRPDGLGDWLEQVGLFESFPEKSSDQPGKRFDMDEKIRFSPLPAITDEAAPRNQEMNMWVISDRSGPGLKNANETDLRAEKTLISCEYHDSLGRRLEKKRIECFFGDDGRPVLILRAQ